MLRAAKAVFQILSKVYVFIKKHKKNSLLALLFTMKVVPCHKYAQKVRHFCNLLEPTYAYARHILMKIEALINMS